MEYDSWMEGYRDYAVAPAWDPSYTSSKFKLSRNNRKLDLAFRPSGGDRPRSIAVHAVSIARSRTMRFMVHGRQLEMGIFAAPSKEALYEELHGKGRGLSLHEVLAKRQLAASVISLVTKKVYSRNGVKKMEGTYNYDVRLLSGPESMNTLSLYINTTKHTAMWEVNSGIGCATPLPGPAPVYLVYSNPPEAYGKGITIVSMNEAGTLLTCNSFLI